MGLHYQSTQLTAETPISVFVQLSLGSPPLINPLMPLINPLMAAVLPLSNVCIRQ